MFLEPSQELPVMNEVTLHPVISDTWGIRNDLAFNPPPPHWPSGPWESMLISQPPAEEHRLRWRRWDGRKKQLSIASYKVHGRTLGALAAAVKSLKTRGKGWICLEMVMVGEAFTSGGEEPTSDGEEPTSDSEEPTSDGEESTSDGEESSSDGEESSSECDSTRAWWRVEARLEVYKGAPGRQGLRKSVTQVSAEATGFMKTGFC